ncbi:immunoglobulin-like domain-containing protein [Rubritalea tangerina]|uniref:Immunoglobulin-like domain-containing protein n=1 Tax=Rubritalea tangerina TaxID=430798 RepID=A0ABW4Z6Q1_9BACT
MKRAAACITLITSVTCAPVWAYPYDDSLSDISDDLELIATQSRTTGNDITYNIPISGWPTRINFYGQGGDGGSAHASTSIGDDKRATGGGGASVLASFDVNTSRANTLRPGGQIRILTGSRGQSQSNKSNVASGGGGGATGVLYRAPEEGAQWELLFIAGGGGGACASTAISQTYSTNGKNANTDTSGDDVGNISGGSDGGAGVGWDPGAGGGAGWTQGAGDDQGGDQFSVGGSGGQGVNDGPYGGFGISGGGAGHRRYDINNHKGGGGGGGGYSGGAGGNDDQSGTSEEGGGGGSYVASWNASHAIIERSGDNQNGRVTVTFSVISSATLTAPSLTLSGESSVTLYNDQPYSEDGASATDLYGNDVTVAISTPSGLTNGDLGTFTITYKATDQFGQTTTVTRSVTRLTNQIPSTPQLSSQTVSENTTLVGTLSSTDPEGEDVSFEIIDGFEKDYFEIINGNQLAFKVAPDYEDPDDGGSDNTYYVSLIANDGAVDSNRSNYIIEVRNVEEAPPAPTLSNLLVDENTTAVGTLSAIDPEGDTVSYSISGGADQNLFQITHTNQLSFKSAQNFENPSDSNDGNNYIVEVTATDGSNISASASHTILVQNVDEAPAAPTLSNLNVVENSTTIGTLSAIDPEGDSVTFAIDSGTDRDLFEIINGSTLVFKGAPDYERPIDQNAGNDYRVLITASDPEGNVSSAERFIVLISDQEEPAYDEFRSTYGLAADGSEDALDRSGNGVANLFYLAFGLGDPSDSEIDVTRLPTFIYDAANRQFVVSYVRSSSLNLEYAVCLSDDLKLWVEEDNLAVSEQATTGTITDLGGGFERVTKIFPVLSGSLKRFYIVAVKQESE